MSLSVKITDNNKVSVTVFCSECLMSLCEWPDFYYLYVFMTHWRLEPTLTDALIFCILWILVHWILQRLIKPSFWAMKTLTGFGKNSSSGHFSFIARCYVVITRGFMQRWTTVAGVDGCQSKGRRFPAAWGGFKEAHIICKSPLQHSMKAKSCT